jgi:Zn-dependent peptidase ImmA (M78 family)
MHYKGPVFPGLFAMNVMHVSLFHLQRALDKVEAIFGYYRIEHIGWDDPKRSIDHLKVTVEKFLEKKVQLVLLPLNRDQTPVHGAFIMKSETEFDIVYVDGLSPEWKRFVICKELFHVILDREDYRSIDLSEHIDAMISAFPIDGADPEFPVLAEFLAEIAAMEFLLPYAARYRELEAGTPLADVATKYGVPLLFVERYMSSAWLDNLDPERILSGRIPQT